MICDWNNPGHEPYRQSGVNHIAKALDTYKFSAKTRNELLWKIKSAQSDAVIFIGRDDIHSSYGTASNLRDMHSKKGMCSGPVQRDSWKVEHREPALVYCSYGQCVAVPVVCGNISKIDYSSTSNTRKPLGISQSYNQIPEPSVYILALTLLGVFQIRKSRLVAKN